jgi:hypothetical protein
VWFELCRSCPTPPLTENYWTTTVVPTFTRS